MHGHAAHIVAARRAPPPDTGHRRVAWLAALGLLGAWVAWVVAAQSVGTSAGEGIVEPGAKPFYYYLAHGAGLLCALAAGVMAARDGQYRRLDPITRNAFWVLQLTAAAWALLSYGIGDYISFKAFGATGPFVWFSTVLIFAGMEKRIWPLIDKVVFSTAAISAVLAVVAVATTHRDITQRWLSTPVYYMVLLMWFGGWTLLSFSREQSLRESWRIWPYIVFMFLTVFTKTRSWFVMSVILLFAFLALNRPAVKARSAVLAHRLKMTAIVLAAAAVMGFILKDLLVSSFLEFSDRAMQDTRSGQYIDFFADVPVTDLILGRGPNGTWDWNGRDYQYFDNALLWMAFIGGIPTAISYVMVVILPGFRALGSGSTEITSSSVLLLFWGLACTGFSTYTNPSLTPHAYLLCLLAGRCLGAVAEKRGSPIRRGVPVPGT